MDAEFFMPLTDKSLYCCFLRIHMAASGNIPHIISITGIDSFVQQYLLPFIFCFQNDRKYGTQCTIMVLFHIPSLL